MGKLIPMLQLGCDLPADVMLEAAKDKLSDVVIVGWVKEERRLYFSTNTEDDCKVLMLLEQCKLALLDAVTDLEDD